MQKKRCRNGVVLDDEVLNEETKRNIRQSEKDIRKGKVHSWEKMKKELNLKV